MHSDLITFASWIVIDLVFILFVEHCSPSESRVKKVWSLFLPTKICSPSTKSPVMQTLKFIHIFHSYYSWTILNRSILNRNLLDDLSHLNLILLNRFRFTYTINTAAKQFKSIINGISFIAFKAMWFFLKSSWKSYNFNIIMIQCYGRTIPCDWITIWWTGRQSNTELIWKNNIRYSSLWTK